MADHSIRFTIGSVFKGEGFTKAQNTVKTMNGEMNKGMGAMNKMSGVLGQMDASAGKATVAMTGMLQAVMSMNATVIISQAAMLALNFAIDGMVKSADEAKKKADALHASIEKAFASTMAERMTSVKKEVADISAEFERITKQANDFTAALNGVQAAQANGGILSLQVEKLNAMLEAHTEAERASIDAAYNLKIAIQKSADSEAAWQLKIEAAEQARTDNVNRLATIDQQIANLSEQRRSLEETMLTAKASGDSHWIEIQKQVNALKDQEAVLEQKRIDTMAASDVLDIKLQQVKQEAENAQTAATAEIRNAELAEVRLTEAKHNREVLEAAAADAAKMDAAEKEADAKEIRTAVDIQKDLNAASKELAAAERAYRAKLNEYLSSDYIREAVQKQAQNSKSGMGKAGLLPVDVQKSIQTTVSDAKVDDAIRNGAVTTVKDADRLQRQAMREARDTISNNQGQAMREAQKYKRLQELNPKALSSSDKDFMAKYDKILKAQEERKKALDDAKTDFEKADERQKDLLKEMKEINKSIKKLGAQ